MEKLSLEETQELRPGALSLATVTLVFTVVILSVVAYKLFMSGGAKISSPDGYKFEWDAK